MQNSIPFQRQNPLQGLQGLARAIALPHEHAPQRFPSFPALERTAVMGFSQNYDLSLTADVECKVGLARQAAYPLWFPQDTYYGGSVLTDQRGEQHESLFATGYAVNTMEIDMNALPIGNHRIDAVDITLANNSWNINTRAKPAAVEGNSRGPIIGRDGTKHYVYVPADTALYVAIWTGYARSGGEVSSSDSFDGTAEFYQWTSPNTEIIMGPLVSISEGSLTAGTGGKEWYYKLMRSPIVSTDRWLRLANASATMKSTELFNAHSSLFAMGAQFVVAASATATFAAVSGNAVLTLDYTPKAGCFLPNNVPDFTVANAPWIGSRTTAAAALFTNVTQALNKSGTVLWGRLPPTVKDMFSFTRNDLAVLHPAEKQYLGLEFGTYSYVPPSTDMTFFWDYSENTLTSPIPLYRLDNDSLVNCAIMKVPINTQLAVTVDWHFEFRTTNTLWQIGMSTITLETLHQAQLALVPLGFFFNNEDHKSTIMAIIGGLKRFAGMLAPIVPLAGTAERILGFAEKVGTPKPSMLHANVRSSRGKRKGRKQKKQRAPAKPSQPGPKKKKGGLQMYLDSKKR